MRLVLPFLIVIFTIATSCEKETLSYKIEGQIVRSNSSTAIPNLAVKLFQKEYKSGVLSNNFTFLEETITNAEGGYKFEIERVRIYEIKIEIDDKNYFTKI